MVRCMTMAVLLLCLVTNGVAAEPAAFGHVAANAMDVAWTRLLRDFCSPETGLVYERPKEVWKDTFPTAAEIVAAIPNSCGHGTGMEDAALNGSSLLLAALARQKCAAGEDAAAKDALLRLYRGLRMCATVSGVPGFLVRSVSPNDGKSYYPNTSRDQYTLFVYAMWRLWQAESTSPAVKREIARMLVDMAAYLQRTVTREHGWSIPRLDGRASVVCDMWADPETKARPVAGGGVAFGGIMPHEALRLPMVYAAAFAVSGELRWRQAYEAIADVGVKWAGLDDPATISVYALVQAQVSQRLLWEIESNQQRKDSYRTMLLKRALFARSLYGAEYFAERERRCRGDFTIPAPVWRNCRMRSDTLPDGTSQRYPILDEADGGRFSFVRDAGEKLLAILLSPDCDLTPEERRLFSDTVGKVDFATYGWATPVCCIWAYWEAVSRKASPVSPAAALSKGRPGAAGRLLKNLRDAVRNGKCVYAWSTSGAYWKDRWFDDFVNRTGDHPLMYFAEFRDIGGTWYSPERLARHRAEFAATVRREYAARHAIPMVTWHLQNPYVPSAWKDRHGEDNQGQMYRYTSKDYPQHHRFVMREILDGSGETCGTGRMDGGVGRSFPNPRAWFLWCLKDVAAYCRTLVDADGARIPIVFRLFHECDGDWFWWGRDSGTPADMIALHRLSVDVIRAELGAENVLFCYSPQRKWEGMGEEGKSGFLTWYPGDAYMDMLGFSDYGAGKRDLTLTTPNSLRRLRQLTEESERRGKLCGIFESGVRDGAVEGVYSVFRRIITAPGVRLAIFTTYDGSYTFPKTATGMADMKTFLALDFIQTGKNNPDLVR